MNHKYINFLLARIEDSNDEAVVSIHTDIGFCIGAMVIDKKNIKNIKKVLNISIQNSKIK
jgi:hypothetical protein